ncbi:MAG: shikimate dehydrogenase [Gemmatimonadaceae bacterium]|nr:shikimate dehydrogenase [Gemmatimonadaceae bacterium]
MPEVARGPLTARERPRGLVILGHPISQSRSPVFQNAALAHAGLALTYERLDTPPDALDATLAHCAAAGIGGNATVPLKELLYERCAQVSPMAARTGAVNTFWFEDGALLGHNTDVDGALATIDALAPNGITGPVVLLGAGGSAAAVCVALAQRGVRALTISARTPARAEALLARVGLSGTVLGPDEVELHRVVRDAALVINTTPVGMRDDALPVAIEPLGAETAVYDLVYREQGTAWTRAAAARGLRAEDGLRMLVEQGAAAFHCWFGEEPSREVMWRALGHAGPPAPDAPRG